MNQSIPSTTQSKPDGCPLWLHSSGRWCKKIKGRFHYFGYDLHCALERWAKEKDYLLAGRRPPSPDAVERLTVRVLCNKFLTVKRQLVQSGRLSTRHWQDLYGACERIIRVFGKDLAVEDLRPSDFHKLYADVVAALGVYAQVSEIARCRSVFNYAVEDQLIERPVAFGALFKPPSAKLLRKERAQNGPKLFTRDEILKLLDTAKQPLRTMILLAINCGYGNTDVSGLPWSAVDLEAGWVSFPRNKTGASRRAKLWPVTVKALKEWQPKRPEPKNAVDAGLVFLTVRGGRFVKDAILDESRKNGSAPAVDNVSREMRALVKKCGIYKPGVAFYCLRHVYRTVADDSRDQPAVDLTMGHSRQDMASLYRERIADVRLESVAEHVRQWLFATPKMTKDNS